MGWLISLILYNVGNDYKWKSGWMVFFFILIIIVFPVIFVFGLKISGIIRLIILTIFWIIVAIGQDGVDGDDPVCWP
jgi:hypothetical protein